MFPFTWISQGWNGTGCWNASSWQWQWQWKYVYCQSCTKIKKQTNNQQCKYMIHHKGYRQMVKHSRVGDNLDREGGSSDSWKSWSHLSWVDTMVADDLAPCVARASATMASTWLSWNILVSAPERLILYRLNLCEETKTYKMVFFFSFFLYLQ